MRAARLLLTLGLFAVSELATAAEVDGRALSAWWGRPLAGMLLPITLLPLLAPMFWHHHFGKVAAGWSLALLLPFAVFFGAGATGQALAHPLLAEHLPFIVLLTALFC